MRGLKLVSFVLMAAIIGVTYVGTAGRADARSNAAGIQPYVTIGNILSGAPINWYNNSSLQTWEMDVMPLGLLKAGAPNPSAAYPQLAKSWKILNKGKAVIVYIQPNARWSNGQQVTATDLVESAEIGYASGISQSFDLGSVKTINSKTVEYTMLPGVKYNLFPREVLAQDITPASVYSHLLPSDIESVIKADEYTGSDPTLVSKQKDAAASLTDLYKKIQAFAPSKDVSDGPYVLTSYNPGEAILKKNKYFYDANKVKIPEVIERNYNNQNQTIWNYLVGGQVYQATSGGMSTALVKRILRVAHNHEYTASSTASAQLVWNESVYPYNQAKVRRAFAYIINRKLVTHVGEPVGGTYNHWPTTTVDSNTKTYLTKAQLKKLNPYNPSVKKATAQLIAAGFKKSGGAWMLPNGKPFTVTLTSVSGFTDWLLAAAQIKSELDSFGIPTTVVSSPSYGQYLTDLAAGKVAFGFWIGTGTTPDSIALRLFGAPDGYNIAGNHLVYFPPSAAGKGNWLDFPQTVSMPHYGKVSIGKVAYKLQSVTGKVQTRRLMQEMLITANTFVPEITLWNYVQVGFVNDKYFTNYPTNSHVLRTCEGAYPPIGCWVTLGFVRPR